MGYGKWIAAAALLTGAFFVAAAWGDYEIAEETVDGITYTLTSPTEDSERITTAAGDPDTKIEHVLYSGVTHLATSVPDINGLYNVFMAVDVNIEDASHRRAYINYKLSTDESWGDGVSEEMKTHVGLEGSQCFRGTVTTDFLGNYYLSYKYTTTPEYAYYWGDIYVSKNDDPGTTVDNTWRALDDKYTKNLCDIYGCRLNISRDGSKMSIASMISYYPAGIANQLTWVSFFDGLNWTDPHVTCTFEGGYRTYADYPVGAVYNYGDGYFFMSPLYGYVYPSAPYKRKSGKSVDKYKYRLGLGNGNYWGPLEYYDHRLDCTYMMSSSASPYPTQNGDILYTAFNLGTAPVSNRHLTIFRWANTSIQPVIFQNDDEMGSYYIDIDDFRFSTESGLIDKNPIRDYPCPQIDFYEDRYGNQFVMLVYNSRATEYASQNPVVIRIFIREGDVLKELFKDSYIYVDTSDHYGGSYEYQCQISPNVALSKDNPIQPPPPPNTGSFDIHTCWSVGDHRLYDSYGSQGGLNPTWADVFYRAFKLSWSRD